MRVCIDVLEATSSYGADPASSPATRRGRAETQRGSSPEIHPTGALLPYESSFIAAFASQLALTPTQRCKSLTLGEPNGELPSCPSGNCSGTSVGSSTASPEFLGAKPGTWNW